MRAPRAEDEGRVAIVGLACRVPGAADAAALWRRLSAGDECVSFFSRRELLAAGVPAELVERPDYVPAHGFLAGADGFDAPFFGLSAWEATLTDPQQRLFLECCWEALEDAGQVRRPAETVVGVYGGAGHSSYLGDHAWDGLDPARPGAAYQALIGNDKDFLASRVAHRLDLRGPAVTVQTACSTSLVAVHLACQALLDGDCDLALAGGVSIRGLDPAGYVWEEGMILSPDGRCRAFDADAAGTVGGSGVGVVALERLADARRDGHRLRAVILGSAVNNDGGAKAGFTAPSVAGQAAAIAEALAVAGIEPASIGYVEAHGTGTPLGDPIEVEALRQAFGDLPAGSCRLGSIKTNLGHLDAAAGVAGLIKVVLALEHGEIPPSLHIRSPNPRLDLASGPFAIASELSPWPGPAPRRAGVSSFGLGGTNAHLVVEEAPGSGPGTAELQLGSGSGTAELQLGSVAQVIVLSAKTPTALAAAKTRLAAHLREAAPPLADLAYTLQVGRAAFHHRWATVCRSREELVAACAGPGATEREAIADPSLARLWTLARRWESGEELDWEAVVDRKTGGPDRRRIGLPTYPFEHQRYRLPRPASGPARRPLDEWLYLPSWRRGGPAPTAPTSTSRRWLLLFDEEGLGPALAARLVARGDEARTARPEEVAARVAEWGREGWRPDAVVHGWEARSRAGARRSQGRTPPALTTLLDLLRACDEAGWLGELRLAIVASGLAEVVDGDRIDPARVPLLAAVRVLRQEHPAASCRAIDLDPTAAAEEQAAAVLAELDAGGDGLVALRGGRRWLESWEPLPLLAAAGTGLRQRGVYWLIGGMGRVGFALARALAEVEARLLITGRGAASPARLGELEEGGAEVLYLQADAADEGAMAAALEAAEARFGALNGVIHAAGETGLDAFAPLAATGEALCRHCFRAKLAGAEVLARLLAGRQVDFVLLCSSLASAVGGVGYLAYTAANLALDAVAQSRSAGGRWLSVGWDGWRDDAALEAGGEAGESWTLTAAEGVEVFRRLLAAHATGRLPARVLVSTLDLPQRARRAASGAAAVAAPVPRPVAIPRPEQGNGRHPRPPHAPAYVPPQSDSERAVAATWSALLGVAEVGLDDDFLALGGDSLLATQVVSRLRQALAVELPLHRLLGGATVASLAQELDATRGTATAREERVPVERVEVEL